MVKPEITKILLVAGARPNFMKIAPILHALQRINLQPITNSPAPRFTLVHTGQHYDYEMSQAFFDELKIGRPDYFLGVGSGSHAVQTAGVMVEFEKVCLNEKPDLVVVVGDVNSTLACALVASKLCIPVAHVEAGLRSFDRTMPEEINRILTDSVSDYLFTTCEDANKNLQSEGIPDEKVHFVGNVMIDTLRKFMSSAESDARISVNGRHYAFLTLHRPSNVDNKETFRNIIGALQVISKRVPVIFPAHPRTQKQIKAFGFERHFNFCDPDLSNIDPEAGINLLSPLPYLDSLNLMSRAKFVLTDSGGIQEETTILGVPCLTLRENTERPITITEGTNTLVGSNREKIIAESFKILDGHGKTGKVPKLWDGHAAERIVEILLNIRQ